MVFSKKAADSSSVSPNSIKTFFRVVGIAIFHLVPSDSLTNDITTATLPLHSNWGGGDRIACTCGDLCIAEQCNPKLTGQNAPPVINKTRGRPYCTTILHIARCHIVVCRHSINLSGKNVNAMRVPGKLSFFTLNGGGNTLDRSGIDRLDDLLPAEPFNPCS